MKWRKLGKVYCADGQYSWAQTHAYIPTVELIDDFFRVYVAFWNKKEVKRIGFVDIDAEDPTKVLDVSKLPVLDVGELGTFDEGGVTPTCILTHDNLKYLYYIGWQPLTRLQRYLFTGLSISKDKGKTFERYIQTPILERNDSERFMRSALFVSKETNWFRGWYVSSNKIIDINHNKVPSYNIKYTTSVDGIHWSTGVECISLAGKNEFGLGRPFVLREDGIYKMFYSIRIIDEGYKIGYAESKDGLIWERKDGEVGIGMSSTGWDSGMICFPYIMDYKNKRYMFYNGNDYGKTGFGVAILE